MRTIGINASVGGFLLLGAVALLYLFSALGETNIQRVWGYTLYADFTSAGELAPGAPVEVAGVQVGQVDSVRLVDHRARVTLTLQNEVEVQEDAIASIRTKGLLGARYVLISPGGSDQVIPPGGKIRETEPPLDIASLLATYMASRNKPPAAKP